MELQNRTIDNCALSETCTLKAQADVAVAGRAVQADLCWVWRAIALLRVVRAVGDVCGQGWHRVFGTSVALSQ